MRYVQRWDDEPFEVRSHEVTRWSCCDCGLVHDIAFVARGKVIEVAARVNKRATAAKRRAKSAAGQSLSEPIQDGARTKSPNPEGKKP